MSNVEKLVESLVELIDDLYSVSVRHGMDIPYLMCQVRDELKRHDIKAAWKALKTQDEDSKFWAELVKARWYALADIHQVELSEWDDSVLNRQYFCECCP